MENNQCILISTEWSWKVLSRIKSKQRSEFFQKTRKNNNNNGNKLATSHVINPCRLSGEAACTEGRIHHSFLPLAPRDTCPSCVDESAYIFWQLWAEGFVKRNHSYCFDCAPPPTPPPGYVQNAFKCDCTTATESKARTQRTSKMSAFYLQRTAVWHLSLRGLDSKLEQAGVSVIAGGVAPVGRPKALDNWAHGAWHSPRPVTTDVLIKASLASSWRCIWRTLHSRGDMQLLWPHFHSTSPVGVFGGEGGVGGHQHWHKSFRGSRNKRQRKKKIAVTTSATHEK